MASYQNEGIGIYTTKTKDYQTYRGEFDSLRNTRLETRINMDQSGQHKTAHGKDAIRKMIEKIKTKLTELKKMHQQHISQVNFTKEDNLKRQIEALTEEITDLVRQTQQSIKTLDTSQGKEITGNIQKLIAVELQEVSENFRTIQHQYLNNMKKRETSATTGLFDGESFDDISIDDQTSTLVEQEQIANRNAAIIKEREKEIGAIAQSIEDLNEIFRDINTLIVDQGTVLDRIDYNIEHASHEIEEGNVQLTKGEEHQKSAGRKYLCLLMVVVIIGLVVGVIVSHALHS